MITRVGGLLVLVACVATTAACTTTTVESFTKVDNPNISEAWRKPGADFSRYSRLNVRPLEIYFSEGLGEPNPDDVEGIRSRFRQAFTDSIAGDYELAQENGADVLTIRASLVDMKVNRGIGNYTGKGRTSSLVTAGQLTLFMEFSDSLTGEVLARAADQEKPADGGSGDLDEATWNEVRLAAEHWAFLLRDFLDRSLDRS